MKNLDKFNFWGGGEIVSPPYDPEGHTPRISFYKYDCSGVLLPCNDPELFKKVMIFKKSLNFQIKQWVEGFSDCLVGVDEYLEELNDPPDWVKKSFIGQLNKIRYK